jgi:hypothetical protein
VHRAFRERPVRTQDLTSRSLGEWLRVPLTWGTPDLVPHGVRRSRPDLVWLGLPWDWVWPAGMRADGYGPSLALAVRACCDRPSDHTPLRSIARGEQYGPLTTRQGP